MSFLEIRALALIWAGFLVAVVLMLTIDLGVFHRKVHVVSLRESLAWSTV